MSGLKENSHRTPQDAKSSEVLILPRALGQQSLSKQTFSFKIIKSGIYMLILKFTLYMVDLFRAEYLNNRPKMTSIKKRIIFS